MFGNNKASMSSIISEVYREVSGESAWRYASSISMLHRIQMSPGLWDAARYVRDQLDSLGIECRLESYRSDGKAEYLGFRSPPFWKLKNAYLKFTSPKETLVGRSLDHPVIVVAHSPSTEGILEAEVVDVGEGDKAECYPDNVEGKVALASGRPWDVLMEAWKHGVAGLLFYRAGGYVVPEAYPYFGIFPWAEDTGKLRPSMTLPYKVAMQVKTWLSRGKTVRVEMMIDAEMSDGEMPVIEARVGSGGSKIFFVAHLCHPHPGANDNASGSGLAVELARASGILYERLVFDGQIVFLWVPEITGTCAYLQSHTHEVREALGCIDLDMVGADPSKTGSVLTVVEPPFSSPGYIHWLIESALGEVVGKLGPSQFSEVEKLPVLRVKPTRFTIGSDHQIFASIGVSSVALITWPDRYYHSSMDRPGMLSPRTLKAVGSSTLSAAILLLKEGREAVKRICIRALRRTLEVMESTTTKKEGYRFMVELAGKQAIDSLSRIKDELGEGVQLVNETISLIEKSTEYFKVLLPDRHVRPPNSRMGWKPIKTKLHFNRRRLVKHMSPELLRKYRETLWEDKSLNVKLWEAWNLSNGRRTIDEIHRIVEAEYNRLDRDFLLEIFNTMVKAGFIAKCRI